MNVIPNTARSILVYRGNRGVTSASLSFTVDGAVIELPAKNIQPTAIHFEVPKEYTALGNLPLAVDLKANDIVFRTVILYPSKSPSSAVVTDGTTVNYANGWPTRPTTEAPVYWVGGTVLTPPPNAVEGKDIWLVPYEEGEQ